MKKTIFTIHSSKVFLLTLIFSLMLFSCNEGIFNFNEETGNISISFKADSVGTDLERVVFTLYNEKTGDDLKKIKTIENHGVIQKASSYISRANAGPWRINTVVYDKDGNPAAQRDDEFILELGQTVIANLEYWDDGSLYMSIETNSGSDLASMVQINNLDTVITGVHFSPKDISSTQYLSVMVAKGSGFDSGIAELRAGYPDGAYFEFTSGGSRAIGGIDVEIEPELLNITRSGYNMSGNYSLTLTDLNGVERTETDNCFIDFNTDTGFISFGGSAYVGGQVLDTMWEINEASANSSVFAYIVNRNNGLDVSENTFALDIQGVGSLDPGNDDFAFAGGAVLDVSLIVLVTIDIDEVTADDVINNGSDPGFVKGSTNLSVGSLPGWLYLLFGEQLNFIGISVFEYNS